MAFHPTDRSIAYATYATFGGTHVWKSTDSGASWNGIDGVAGAALPDIPVHSIVMDPGDPSRLYVGTDLGSIVSLDGGAHWAVENSGFANVVTHKLWVNSIGQAHTLFAFTHGRGAYRVPLTPARPDHDLGMVRERLHRTHQLDGLRNDRGRSLT